jgi:inner membrane protease subunit 2
LNPHGSAWRDIVLFDHYSISSGKWERGDVVAVWWVQLVFCRFISFSVGVRSPVDPDRLLVKRIVAVAGDTVCINR